MRAKLSYFVPQIIMYCMIPHMSARQNNGRMTVAKQEIGKDRDNRRDNGSAPNGQIAAWLDEVGARGGPRYLAIVEAVRDAVRSGTLKPGDRLPPQREVAERLALNLGTVTRAYEEMCKSGLARGEVGRGTFLSHPSVADGPDSIWNHARSNSFVDLSHNFPQHAPIHPAIADIRQAMLSDIDIGLLLAEQVDTGTPAHRRAGARWLDRFGILAEADDVVVTCGTQHGLLLSLAALSQPGDMIMTEDLTFYGLKSAAGLLGRTLVGVRMDREGLMPSYLDIVCRRTGSKILFCTPTLHNPTTATMSIERRREIIEVCRRNEVTIVEDDAYVFMPEETRPPLASMAPDIVVYVTGLSKVVGPGLRIGFVKAPQKFAYALGVALRATTLMASPLNAELASRFIASPLVESIVSAIRDETRARHAIVAQCFDQLAYLSQPAAYFVGLRMPEHWSAEAFAKAAEMDGVGVTPFNLFEVGSRHHIDAVRVCVNAAPNREVLRAALKSLADLTRQSASCIDTLRGRGAVG